MIHHFFLVDFKADTGKMYRVGILSNDSITLDKIKEYLMKYSNEVLYEKSTCNVKERYLKNKRKTPIGEIFMTKFLFDKTIKVPYEHWSSQLRRKILAKQNNKVYLENE